MNLTVSVREDKRRHRAEDCDLQPEGCGIESCKDAVTSRERKRICVCVSRLCLLDDICLIVHTKSS